MHTAIERTEARMITARVIAVRGTCNAELQPGDSFLLEGLRITPYEHDRTCMFACASLTANAGRLKLYPQGLCLSCPDPATGQGGNVLFELSWTEQHERHQG